MQARVIFWERPGCAGNAEQKALLRAAGHELEVRNLLSEPWTAISLYPFLAAEPVAAWFNRAAPRVKSGEIVPERIDAADALLALLEDPLLIRRPLLQVGAQRRIGFDAAAIDAWIGLGAVAPDRDLEQCRRLPGESCKPG